MRQGPYELLVLNSDSVAYEERDLFGKPCVRAEPGREYHILVNVYRNNAGRFPAKYLRFGLFVDGIDVQYWKRLDLSDTDLLPTHPLEPVSSRFWGFKKNVNDIRSFLFSLPETSYSSSAKMENGDFKSLGSVKLVVYEASVTNGVYENQGGQFEAPSAQAVSEQGKFWEQASLTTAAGRQIVNTKEKFVPLPRWSNLRKVPDEVLTVSYHTASMIDFLEEHQHTLVPTVHAPSVTATAHNMIVDLISDGEATDTDSTDLVVSSAGSGKRRRLVAEHTTEDILPSINQISSLSASTSSSSLAVATETGEHSVNDRSESTVGPTLQLEIPIDEEITYVLRKKVAPFLDLSEEADEASKAELVWSTISS